MFKCQNEQANKLKLLSEMDALLLQSFLPIMGSVRKFKIPFYFSQLRMGLLKLTNIPVVRFSTIHQRKTSKAAHASFLFNRDT